MKNTMLIAIEACGLLTANSHVMAAPTGTKHQAEQIRAMCGNKSTRLMMIHELMSTTEGKLELARMLEHDAEFRSYYETRAVNPG